jgi:hypothetical protein
MAITEPRTICIDFDKTLCDSNYPDVGPPKPGAKEALQAFRDMGFRIIVSSCRSCSQHWELYYPNTPFVPAKERPVHLVMVKWLDEHQMPYDEIDDGTLGKISALLYVDDKGLRFMDDWPWIVEWVRWNLNGGKN